MNTNEIKELALKDMEMSENEMAQAVESLRHWLDRQPHLPHSLSDQELTAFIIGCKSVEKAKVKIDTYFTARGKYPTFYLERDPKLFKKEELQPFCILPGTTPEGYRVMFLTIPEGPELSALSYEASIKYALTLLDVDLQAHPYSLGSIVVVDGSKLSLEYVSKMTLSATSQSIAIYQSTLPIRIKGVIWFNAPSILEMVLNTFIKPFSSEKLKSRIFTYSGDETCLAKHLPLSMLPKEYIGGQSGSIKDILKDSWEKVLDYRDWLIGPGSEQSDELKRPISENGDLAGSFRRLEVD